MVSMKNSFFFTQHVAEEVCFSWFLLGLRLLFGGLLMMHGIVKIANFSELSATFPDLLGVGSYYSLILAVFAEVICSCACIVGLLFRLALIPMIVTMAVAFWGVHGGNISEGELSFIFLIVFILLWLAGPGLLSVDKLLFGKSVKPQYSRYYR